MDRNEFAKDLSIDPNQLDVEWLRQAETFFKWAERAREARAEEDRLKLKLELIEAEVELEIRENPDEHDLKPGPRGGAPTEAAIKAALKGNRKYRRALERYSNARSNAAYMDRAREAMDVKKRALENLVTLHGQNYFAGPATPRKLAKEWTKFKEAGEKRLAKRQLKVSLKRRRGA